MGNIVDLPGDGGGTATSGAGSALYFTGSQDEAVNMGSSSTHIKNFFDMHIK
jgi:hypothetical protein